MYEKGFLIFSIKLMQIYSAYRNQDAPKPSAPEFEGYEQYWNDAERKGYSGTAIYTRTSPLSVSYGLGIEEHDNEGRVITIELEEFFLICVYTPNSKTELERLDYRMVWEDEFRNYALKLEQMKPVIICGDLNVAHKEIDLKIRTPTDAVPDLQTKKEKNLLSCWTQGMSIHTDIFILMLQEHTLGGVICLMPAKTMRAGE